MPLPQTVTGVPENQVGNVVQSFIDRDRATRITAKQEGGRYTWSVRAE